MPKLFLWRDTGVVKKWGTQFAIAEDIKDAVMAVMRARAQEPRNDYGSYRTYLAIQHDGLLCGELFMIEPEIFELDSPIGFAVWRSEGTVSPGQVKDGTERI